MLGGEVTSDLPSHSPEIVSGKTLEAATPAALYEDAAATEDAAAEVALLPALVAEVPAAVADVEAAVALLPAFRAEVDAAPA